MAGSGVGSDGGAPGRDHPEGADGRHERWHSFAAHDIYGVFGADGREWVWTGRRWIEVDPDRALARVFRGLHGPAAYHEDYFGLPGPRAGDTDSEEEGVT